ncbi:type I 3-dehydroquinate dehydratase [Treponema sp.]
MPLAQGGSDPTSWLGSTLEQAFLKFGVPDRLRVARGTEDWQDDVVFVYKDLELFWFKDRVWQVRVQSAYGVQLGDTAETVAALLGEPLHKRDKLLVYQLSGRAWPIRLRLGLDEAGRVLDLYIYRSDFRGCMAKVCLCLTGQTIAQDLEILEKYRSYIDLAELRVDFLDADERFYIRRFPELAGIPTILTVRRRGDGGCFAEGEGSRIVLLASGLAFADADRRRNFAYVDLEEDLDVPSLEEAARTFGTRIIRSFHEFQGMPENIASRILSLRRSGDEIAKVAVMPKNLGDLALMLRAAKESGDGEKIVLGMGPYGSVTRILAEKFGSFLSYTSPHPEFTVPSAAPGQLDPKELVELYRYRSIKASTRVFGIVGYPLLATSSPEIHNAAFKRANLDAVYLPFRTDSLSDFQELALELGVEGASVTIPFKEEVVPYLASRSAETEAISSCNTIVKTPSGWAGYNTDARGFSDSLLAFMGRKHLRGKKISIIGAGGVALSVASEIHRLGGRACVLNRTLVRAKLLAERYGFAWGSLDERGIELIDKYRDAIIQTTSVGMEGELDADPIELYHFRGKEYVMDLIYKPEKTQMLLRAEKAGCPILNGRNMLQRQAELQFKLFTGLDFPD